MKGNVFVGLSGGVDSAVSAMLLRQQGYEVTGAFIKIWQPEFIECTWKEDRLDAIRVCAKLGIPFREIDLSTEYQKEVADEMIAAYARGTTPNPDVSCNEKIKFGHFARWALDNGAAYVATGHYAQVRDSQLVRGRDASKDQSYFLYRIAGDMVARTIFPIGHLMKSEVRALARHAQLPVADKPDSQGLCFVGQMPMREYLSHSIPVERGAVVDMNGRTVGSHEGAALYTIGERHGLSLNDAQGPYYVVSSDVQGNTLKVSRSRSDAERSSLPLKDVHWISREPTIPFRSFAQVRYREKAVGATLQREGSQLVLSLEEPRIVSAGQSVVFYESHEDGDICLGGGIVAV